MTGRNRKRSFKASYDFTVSEDTVYSPFDGVFSVPFVIPEENTDHEKAELPTHKKWHSVTGFIKTAAFLTALLAAFIPSLKSDIAAVEILYGKDSTLYLHSFNLKEFSYGIDFLKADSIEEERAYVRATKIPVKPENTATKVSKTVNLKARKKGFVWPTKGAYEISSAYGYREPHISGWSFHGGIDIVTGKGDSTGIPVVATDSGTVMLVSESYRGYGHSVLIDHGKGIVTRYAHMQPKSLTVSKGEKVKAGQEIGKIGSTGNTTGPHLHFEVLLYGIKKNPLYYFDNEQ